MAGVSSLTGNVRSQVQSTKMPFAGAQPQRSAQMSPMTGSRSSAAPTPPWASIAMLGSDGTSSTGRHTPTPSQGGTASPRTETAPQISDRFRGGSLTSAPKPSSYGLTAMGGSDAELRSSSEQKRGILPGAGAKSGILRGVRSVSADREVQPTLNLTDNTAQAAGDSPSGQVGNTRCALLEILQRMPAGSSPTNSTSSPERRSSSAAQASTPLVSESSLLGSSLLGKARGSSELTKSLRDLPTANIQAKGVVELASQPWDLTKDKGRSPLDLSSASQGRAPLDLSSASQGRAPLDLSSASQGRGPLDLSGATQARVPYDISSKARDNLDASTSTQGKNALDLASQVLMEMAEHTMPSNQKIEHEEKKGFDAPVKDHKRLDEIHKLIEKETRTREEAMISEAVRRDEVEARLEQHFRAMLKEEAALRKAIEKNFEGRLTMLHGHVRDEMDQVSTQQQRLTTSMAELRQSISKDIEQHRYEMERVQREFGNVCLRLKDEVFNAVQRRVSITPPATTAGSLSVPSAQQVPAEPHAPADLDKLAARAHEEANQLMLKNMQELVAETQKRLEAETQSLESRLQAQIRELAEASPNNEKVQNALIQQATAKTESSLTNMLEDKILAERRNLSQKMTVQQDLMERRLQSMLDEQAMSGVKLPMLQERLDEVRSQWQSSLQAHEQVVQRQLAATLEAAVGGIVERTTKELSMTKQELVEMKEEFNELRQTEDYMRQDAQAKADRNKGEEARLLQQCRNLQDEQGQLRQAIESQEMRLTTVKQDMNLEVTKITIQSQELITSLSNARDAVSSEASKRREEVSNLHEKMDSLREQVHQTSRRPQIVEASSTAAGFNADREELLSAVRREREARESANSRVLSQAREMLREAEIRWEEEHQKVANGISSHHQTLFIESGKREERDRDILEQLQRTEHDIDTVKRQVTNAAFHREKLDEIAEELHSTKRALECRIVQLSDRLEDVHNGSSGDKPKLRTLVQLEGNSRGEEALAVAAAQLLTQAVLSWQHRRDRAQAGHSSLKRVVGADEASLMSGSTSAFEDADEDSVSLSGSLASTTLPVTLQLVVQKCFGTVEQALVSVSRESRADLMGEAKVRDCQALEQDVVRLSLRVTQLEARISRIA